MIAAAAALVVAAGTGIAVVVAGGDNGAEVTSTLTLSGGSGRLDGVLHCFRRGDPRWNARRVRRHGHQITPEAVTLDVDRWYTAGDADVVSIALPDGRTSAALDGVDFRQDIRYLVTATDGVVNGCGFSGRATPDLEAAYAEAFPG